LASFYSKCKALREVDIPISTNAVVQALIESGNPLRKVILSRGAPVTKGVRITIPRLCGLVGAGGGGEGPDLLTELFAAHNCACGCLP